MTQSSNPYYDYATVRDLSMFFGRRSELSTLYNAIDKRQCFSIVGPRHIGKSSLLKYLGTAEMQQLAGYDLHDRIFILTDWREYLYKTREDFFHAVCGQIIAQSQHILPLHVSQAAGSGEGAFKKILQDIHSAGFRSVLLMDAFDKVTRNSHFDPDFFSFLRALAGISDLISYVTASLKPLYEVCHSDAVASSPFFNIFQTCILSSLTLEEAQELITIPAQRAGHPFTPEEVRWILALAGRHPFFIQVLCRLLFEEKVRQQGKPPDLQHVQEQAYNELSPHIDQLWNDLSEDQRNSLSGEISSGAVVRRKHPEMSESGLFRKRIRAVVQTSQPEITAKEVKDVLDNLDDTEFLACSKIAEMHCIVLRTRAMPAQKKGILVRDFLKEGFERMRSSGLRNDSSSEWRSYNILWYHYFKYHLPNSQTAARLGIGSLRQFYREQEKAIELLLKELLDLEKASLHDAEL